MNSVKQFFPQSTIGVVHQNGNELSDRARGVTVELHFAGNIPTHAEVYGGDHYADVGLEMSDAVRVSGYDGVFECPDEVLQMLRERGFDVSEIE